MPEKEPAPKKPKTEAPATPVSKKTPLFQAFHAPRYQRQALIQEINKITGTKLICYVAGLAAPIDRDDPMAFADLLFNLTLNQDVDLLILDPPMNLWG